jgi:Tol biopolymer transport system component
MEDAMLTVALKNITGTSAGTPVTRDDTLIGTTDPGALVTISDGSTVLGTVTADTSGAWSFAPAGLADGLLTLTVTETIGGGPATPILASDSAGGTVGNADAFTPVFSPDGTKIAFASTDTNLGPASNGQSQIYIKDLTTGAVTLVSTDASGNLGTAASTAPAFAPNGAKIAFTSNATNLGPASDGSQEIYLKDLSTGVVTLVSPYPDSYHPVFSANGNEVAFISQSSGLGQVFVKNLTTGAVTLASSAADGTSGNSISSDPVFSPDGTEVAFYSYDTNLGPASSGSEQVYLKNLSTQTVQLLSSDANGVSGNAGSYNPVFSPDGTKVAFWSNATNLVSTSNGGRIYIKDLATNAITEVAGTAGGIEPVFSPDGSKIAFLSVTPVPVQFTSYGKVGGANWYNLQVEIKDLVTGAVTLIGSPNPVHYAATDVAFAEHFANWVTFSPDGSKIAYDFANTNLMAAPPGPEQIYVANLNTGTVVSTATLSFTLDTVAPTVTISGGGLTNQASQTISGTVTAAAGEAAIGSTVTLFDNGTQIGTVTIGADGKGWSAPVTLISGANSIVAKDTDAAGNTGASPAVVYTLGTVAPAVTITSPQGGYTNKASQTIGGTVTKAPGETGTPGATVTLYDNGSTTALATATVTNGSWSVPVTLSAGANSIVAKDTDTAGNTGASTAVVYTLDTVAPTLTITSPSAGPIGQASQTIGGTVTAAATGGAPIGSTVSLFDNGTQIGTATIGADGKSWSTPVTLSAGANSIVAKDTDAAGNTGSSKSVAFTLSVASGVTVAYFLANRATLDALNNGFTIADSSSTIVKNLTGVSTDPLNDSNINAISLTDSPAKLTTTVAQALNDETALNNIAKLPSTFTVADKAAAIQALTVAQINVLSVEGVTDLNATDKAATLTSAQTTALNNAGISVDPFV